MSTQPNEREMFEAWFELTYLEPGDDIQRHGDSDYGTTPLRVAWRAWQQRAVAPTVGEEERMVAMTGRISELQAHLEAASEYARDRTMLIAMIAERLEIPLEPHQDFDGQILEAIDKLVDLSKRLRGKGFPGDVEEIVGDLKTEPPLHRKLTGGDDNGTA